MPIRGIHVWGCHTDSHLYRDICFLEGIFEYLATVLRNPLPFHIVMHLIGHTNNKMTFVSLHTAYFSSCFVLSSHFMFLCGVLLELE